jgi:predicted metalloprotease with PDZ domain
MLFDRSIKELLLKIILAATVLLPSFPGVQASASTFNLTLNNEIYYQVSFERPHTHYCGVEIKVTGVNSDSVVFAMPVWTPGSYLVREFARNVEGVKANDGSGSALKCEKVRKNMWKVLTSGADEITLKYKVYCNELTVRTSRVNEDHAYLNGANVFMSVKGMEDKKCMVQVNPYPSWKKISTGLRKEGGNLYSAANYDILVDSPIEIGNQNILEFEFMGKKHFICLAGEGNYDEQTLIKDFRKIVETEYKMFDDLPYEDFTFIVHLVGRGGGGLEHLNSFTVQMNRWDFTDEKQYKKFMALIAHEFFHVWNVKRIRPEALGPFNYDEENYTKGLWVSEGWTSFYDNLITKRAGIFTKDDYYEYVEKDVNNIMPYRGRLVQSVEESSYDAWIKLYRRDENFENSQISYYNKGALTALMLNIEIINSSNGAHSLDDALRVLWADFRNDPSRGFTDARIKDICEQLAGKSLDDFWQKYVSGTEDLPLNDYLNMAGLEIVNTNESGKASLDIETRSRGNNLEITKVYSGGSGYESGLNSGDIIVSINGKSVTKDSLDTVIKQYRKGDELKIIVNRDELTREIKVRLIEPLPKYKVKELADMNDSRKKIWRKWIEG